MHLSLSPFCHVQNQSSGLSCSGRAVSRQLRDQAHWNHIVRGNQITRNGRHGQPENAGGWPLDVVGPSIVRTWDDDIDSS